MTDQTQDSHLHAIKVWDLPTRIFHWSLAVIVVAAYFTGDDDIPEIIIHTYLGYAVGALLVFRIIWGVAGNRHARFGDFIKPWSETLGYTRQLLRLSPPAYVGHNPLGGLMIIAMIGVLTVIVVTGVGAALDEGVSIPLSGALPHWMLQSGDDIHEGAAELIMILAGLHVAGVVVDMILTRENLIKAMITGVKKRDNPDAATPTVGAWRAIAVTGLLGAAWAWLVVGTRF